MATISAQGQSNSAQKPNIIVIVADDLGWDDVSFHGSPQIPTPNIDALALSGVILNNYYVSPSSFATKCEIMTGKYATRLGVQHGVIHNKQPVALPETEKILPQYMKELGYNTHAVGKWSLGFYKESLLPWRRGFDTFFGGLTSSGADYFTYSAYDENYGLDLRRNEEVIHNETGHYITNIYTNEAVNIINNHNKSEPLFLYVAHQAVHSGNADDPLQAPLDYVKKVAHIRNAKRKLFGGMVAALDESLQNITVALSSNRLLENSIIIFSTTAGGAVGGMELNMGSNFPLRGSKMTVWEGGIRGVSFVYSEKIQENSRVNEEMFHATDWLPTILGLAGGDWKSMKQIDGFNVWDAISHENYMSPRFEILHQFDPLQKNQCALRVGDYKLIINQDIGFYGDWYPRPAEVGELQDLTKPSTLPNAKVTCDKSYPHPFLEMHAPPCDPMRKPCLFNIQWDPCEFHNLADFMPNTLKVLLDRLHFYRTRIVKPLYPKFDPKADPEYHDGVWGPWVNTSKFYDEFNHAAFIPIPSPSSTALLVATTNTTAPENETDVHQKNTIHPVAGVMKVINPLPANISLPAPTFPVNKTADSIIPNAVTASFLPTASAIQPYSPPDTYTNISAAIEIPENYTIPALPANASAELEAVAASPPQTIALTTANGDHVSITTENRNASKTQNHEFSNVVGEALEGGNVGTQMTMKGKTTHVDLLQNETTTPVETSATLEKLNIDKNKNVSTSGIVEGGMTFSATTTNTQQNVEKMNYESGPVHTALGGAKVLPENVTTTTVEVASLAVPTQANETIIQEPPPPAPPAPVAPEPPVPAVPAAPAEPAPPPVPVVTEEQKPAAPQKPAPEPQPEATEAAVKPQAPVVNPYSIAQPAEPVKPLEPAKPLVPEAPSAPAIPLPPAVPSHPTGASLRPEKNKATPVEQSKLGVGTTSNTTVEHEVGVNANAFTEAKTDSKLPALQNPHVIAALTNLAEAGKPGKSGMASEVAIVAGNDLAPAKGEKPIAQNFVKEPKYDAPAEPAFDKPVDPFAEFKSKPMLPGIKEHEKTKIGTATSAGSTTESETVVGAGAKTGSDTKIKQKQKGGLNEASPSAEAEVPEKDAAKAMPVKLPETKEEAVAKAAPAPAPVNESAAKTPAANKTAPIIETVLTAAKSGNQSIGTLGGPATPKPKLESFLKTNKPNLVNSLKALSLHGPDKGIEVTLATGQHNDLPNSIINGHRTFQSVVDLVSDSSNQICAPGARNCIPRLGELSKDSGKPGEAVVAKPGEIPSKNETAALTPDNVKALKEGSSTLEQVNEPGTQATSNQLYPEQLGTRNVTISNPEPVEQEGNLNHLPAQEKLHQFFGRIKLDNKKMFYISGTASEQQSIMFGGSNAEGASASDVKKHNIGFNVMLPSNEIKQVTPIPKFKERTKIEGTNKTVKEHGARTEGHVKSKSEIKKVFDMIADPARTRKMKVPENPVTSQKVLVNKGSIAEEGEVQGDTGDIGATKPLKGSESKTVDITSSEANATEKGAADKKSKAPANVEAGDLGSIVTLVGKVKVDRLSTKRTKHNSSKDYEKKDKTKSEHLSSTVHNMKHNGTETNAANIDRLSGPSNSIIVSSVIVVLIASFVVVGMAVVAVVAVVARHCRLGKQLDAT